MISTDDNCPEAKIKQKFSSVIYLIYCLMRYEVELPFYDKGHIFDWNEFNKSVKDSEKKKTLLQN